MTDLHRVAGPTQPRRSPLALPIVIVIAIAIANPAHAQTTGTIVGQVSEETTATPLATAAVIIEQLGRSTITAEDGRFVLAGVPTGIYTVRIELLSYRTTTLERVEVRAGRRTNVPVTLSVSAIEMEPIVVEAERIPLIEPEVSETHHVILGRQIRELPIDNTEGTVELTPGVTDGHFRGGRIGQETYVVDGFGVKNQLEASSQGLGLEFAPSSLQEIDVTTGGFGAEYGSALSGVVSFVTRRGDPDKWSGRVKLLGDHWAPDDFSRGFTELSASAGGPLRFLGSGTTLFADILLQGMLDADPRSKGLTCLEPGQVEPELALAIDSLANDPSTAHLYCPYTGDMLPHQQGDKFIGFLRLDVPMGQRVNLTGSLLRNRFQRQLYTQDFKYNPTNQLGQRLTGTMGSLLFDWAKDTQGKALHFTARAAAMRLDRHLGVVDPDALAGRSQIGGFGFSDLEFLGEDFVRLPVEEQRAAGNVVPGYEEPGGSTGSPFGAAAEGIFYTDGTPGIANWSRFDLLGADLVGELIAASGHSLRAGLSGRYHTVENYERPFAYSPDSIVNFDRYHPATLTGFAELRVHTGELFAASLGFRLESFRSGLGIPTDTTEGTPTIDTSWKHATMPRVGFAGAFRNSAGETSFRLNYSRVAQPPDFRFFIDTTIGDSLRTDIRRQGNPSLGFEKGRAYEIGVSHVYKGVIGVSVTAFRKDLTNLVTGTLQISGIAPGIYSTGDKGTIQGVEITAHGGWPSIEFRAGYTLQEATGITSGALDDDEVDPEAQITEYPLAYDRRHSIDFVLLGGRATGWEGTGWGVALALAVRSGFPLDRREELITRLPWTSALGIRITRDLGGLPLCDGCMLRVMADARNVTGRDNVIALRRDTGGLGPPADQVNDVMNEIPLGADPIPRESRLYNPLGDLDGNGLITAPEMRTARLAAELDRNDPSLFYGEASQLRLGLELVF